jgi:Asp-tRNA(Asn)/Glu-tRNA(Gln) amidotransferase A subunit family amidase
LANTVADLQLLLKLVTGPTPGDPDAIGIASRSRSFHRMPDRLFATERLVSRTPLPGDIQHSFDRSLKQLETVMGTPVERVAAGALFNGADPDRDWALIYAPEDVVAVGRKELSDHITELDPAVAEWVQLGLDVTIGEYLGARQRRFDHVRTLDQILGRNSILATPTVTIDSIPADGRLPGTSRAGIPMDTFNTAVANLTGHPALTLPAGNSGTSMPFGLQLIAPRWKDYWLLRLGQAWEEAQPWPLTAPGYDSLLAVLGV